MRSLSITALMILAAFVLGLALGGQMPREASAASQSVGITWKNNGQTLVLTNMTTDKGFLVRGTFLPGAEAEAPASYTDGILQVAAQDLDRLNVYDLKPVYSCDHLSCRSCDELPALCQMPPRPLPEEDELLVTMGRMR